MTNFFHGWRTKAGCVTLLLACVFAAGWRMSQIIRLSISFCPTTESMYHLNSSNQGISLVKAFDPPPIGGPRIWVCSWRYDGDDILEPIGGEIIPPETLISYESILLVLAFVSAGLWPGTAQKPNATIETN